jgi:predicted Zn finger-like uncharacterized protein
MSISFRCPHCKATGRIAEKYLGKTVRCPKCGGSVLAQGSGSVEPAIQSPANLKSDRVCIANAPLDATEGSVTRMPPTAGPPAVVSNGGRSVNGLLGSTSPHSTDLRPATRFSSLPGFLQRPTRRSIAAVVGILIVAVLIAKGSGLFASKYKSAPAKLSFTAAGDGSKTDAPDVVMTLTTQWWDTEPGLTAMDAQKVPDVVILPGETQKLDEESFALFAVEDLARDWYRLVKHEYEGFRANNEGAPASPLNSALESVAAFRQESIRQKRAYDTLRRHLQKTMNEDFVQNFTEYEVVLNTISNRAASLEQPLARYDRTIRAIQQAAAARVLANGLGLGLSAWARGERDDTAFAIGVFGGAAAASMELPKANQAKKTVNAQLEDDFRVYLAGMSGVVVKVTDEWAGKIKQSRWDLPQRSLNSNHGDPHSRNPFERTARAVWQAARDEEDVAQHERKTVAAKRLLQYALVCRQAADQVPDDPHTYDSYRAFFLKWAGRIANRAAAIDLGETGLPQSPDDAPEGGVLAREIWDACVKFQTFDTEITDEVVQNQFLARAYAGDAKGALDVIAERAMNSQGRGSRTVHTPRTSYSKRPDFWYDCARILSITGHPQSALQCLTIAFQRGFRDRERAKLCLDFANVRQDHQTGDKFKTLIENGRPAPSWRRP